MLLGFWGMLAGATSGSNPAFLEDHQQKLAMGE